MLNFLKKSGIKTLKIVYTASTKVLNVAFRFTWVVGGFTIVLPKRIIMESMGFRRYAVPIEEHVTLFLNYESTMVQWDTTKNIMEHYHGNPEWINIDPEHNPFALAKIQNGNKAKKKTIFYKAFMNNLVESVGIAAFLGFLHLILNYTLPPFLTPFLKYIYILPSLLLVKDVSRNALIAIDTDNSMLIKTLCTGESENSKLKFKNLSKVIKGKQYTELELSRFKDILDFYNHPTSRNTDGNYPPTVPYNQQDFSLLHNIYAFVRFSQLRRNEDKKLEKILNKNCHLSRNLNKIIISYTNGLSIENMDNETLLELRNAELGL